MICNDVQSSLEKLKAMLMQNLGGGGGGGGGGVNKVYYGVVQIANDTSMGRRKHYESPTGIEPMASQIPVGRSNQLSYEKLVVNLAILLGDFFLCHMLVSLLKKIIFKTFRMCKVMSCRVCSLSNYLLPIH